MAVVARGHVRDRPFARSIYAMAAKRFSGDFVMTQGGRSYKITWQGGVIVGADSPSPADSLGRIALTAGLVNSTQLGDALRLTTTQPDRSQLDILARVAQLTPQQVLTVKRRALAHRAVRVFTLDDATFVLDDVGTLEPDPAVSPLGARWVIYQGVRAHYGEDRLAAELDDRLGASLRLAPTSRPVLHEYGFGADGTLCVTELSRRAMTIDELGVALPRMTRKGIMAVVYALVATDAVAVASPDAAAAGSTGQGARAERAGRSEATGQAGVTGHAASAGASPPAVGPAANTRAAPEARRRRPTAPKRFPSTPPATRRADTIPDAVPGPQVAGSDTDAVPTAITHEDGSLEIKITGSRTAQRRPVDPARIKQIEAFIANKAEELDAGVDHYAMLGVARGASDHVIRAAYFALAKKLHPDILRSHGVADASGAAHRVLAHINQAYAVLSNPQRRAEYAAVLAAGGETVTRERQARAEEFALRAIEAEKHFQQGEMAARRDQWADALESFRKAVKLNPEDAEHHALLGWATWRNARDREAVLDEVKKIFKRAITLSPRSVAAYLYRGRVAADIGDYPLALDCFNKVLKLEPDHSEAALQIRLIESRHGRSEKRKGLLDRLKGR